MRWSIGRGGACTRGSGVADGGGRVVGDGCAFSDGSFRDGAFSAGKGAYRLLDGGGAEGGGSDGAAAFALSSQMGGWTDDPAWSSLDPEGGESSSRWSMRVLEVTMMC